MDDGTVEPADMSEVSNPPSEPRAPDDRRCAVEAIPLEDESLMGRIYRYGLEGKEPGGDRGS